MASLRINQCVEPAGMKSIKTHPLPVAVPSVFSVAVPIFGGVSPAFSVIVDATVDRSSVYLFELLEQYIKIIKTNKTKQIDILGIFFIYIK